MFEKIITSITKFLFYTEILCVRTDKYTPIKYKYVKKSYLRKIKIYKTWTCEPIYDEEHDKYYMVDTYHWNYGRGSKLLVQDCDTKEIRIATVKAYDKIGTFPDLLDGHEAPGITHIYKGVVIE